MSRSVFENKYTRRKSDGSLQSWSERVGEVVAGNFSLDDTSTLEDHERTLELSRMGIMPFSGRHLQHGDLDQPSKMGESFTNCSTAMFSFINFWLLLKGSGVGRCYDSDLCRVNWDKMPNIRLVLEGPDTVTGVGGHSDFEEWMERAQDARHKYDSESEAVRWFEVEDSAEGWVKVVEAMETAAWQEKHTDKLFIFDFTKVRSKGTPIRGQQGRPASGPAPFMRALQQVSSIKGAGMKPWKQAMFIDHYLAACVAMGGIRRSARIAVKSWRDRDVIEFIDIKRGGFLYTANNSVSVDVEFWEKAKTPAPSHARRVFEAMTSAAYFDATGEPAFLNVDRMTWNDEGMDEVTAETFLGCRAQQLLRLHPRTLTMVEAMLEVAKRKRFPFIVNPCGEVILAVWGGYCMIGDICLANARSLQDVLDAGRLMAQFLVRANTMDFLYAAELKRTNRIGVAITGIHEFAYRLFGMSFQDLLEEDRSHAFWGFLANLRRTVEKEAEKFATERGLAVPHTAVTIKPSGTISKVMCCTEGAHLPAHDYYMRWVQYPIDDPEVEAHKLRGYPVKDVSHQYSGHVVVGFPTRMPVAELMGEDVTVAQDATPEEHYQWLKMLETHWLGEGRNNQISYTLKYDPKEVNYEDFMSTILTHQKDVRACAVMPETDLSAYAYTPEERISREVYEAYMISLNRFENEAYDEDLLSCEGGACPIEPNVNGSGRSSSPPELGMTAYAPEA
jgi:adenosylcobalamin-dependent ribonucleoside-triphosphate reductase